MHKNALSDQAPRGRGFIGIPLASVRHRQNNIVESVLKV